MLWRVWVAAGAAVCGVAIAALLGGSSHSGELILGALVIAGVLSIVVARKPRWASPPRTGIVAPARTGDPEPADRDIVDRLFVGIQERDLAWLRAERFDGPWRSTHDTTFRRIAAFLDGDEIAQHELRASVTGLRRAAETFLDVYDENTIPDPVTRDGTWRVARARETEAPGVDTSEARRHLVLVATEVCARYDEVCLMTGRVS